MAVDSERLIMAYLVWPLSSHGSSADKLLFGNLGRGKKFIFHVSSGQHPKPVRENDNADVPRCFSSAKLMFSSRHDRKQ